MALVTGATRGIGHAVAVTLAEQGYAIAVHGRTAERVDAVAAELADKFEVPTLAVAADVGQPDQVRALLRAVFEHFRRLDALVVNAGVHTAAPIGLMTDTELEQLFGINTLGAVHTLSGAARLLRRGSAPAAVLVASVVATRGAPGQTAYAASKAAVVGLTLAAAKELGPAGIRVNAVAPGFIDTDMLGPLDAEARAARIAATALGRLGQAQDVADAVCFLLSDRARFITGQVLGVDGGLVI